MIAVHEEHGELVETWVRQGYRQESVICFDRHLDLKPLTAAASSRLHRLGADDNIEAENRKLPIREVSGSFGLDDFYAAGALLGNVSKLTWVRASNEVDSPAARIRMLDALSVIAAEPDILRWTFFDERGALHTSTCGLKLVLQTPHMFAAARHSPASRVDLDLDWFADVQTGQDHEPAELLDLLRYHGLDGNVDSMTFSVRSGFLPESRRDLAAVLAREFGQKTKQRPRNAIPLPNATFATLRGHSGPQGQDLTRYETELASLGSVGVVLLGLLHLHVRADLDRAGQAWQDAADDGCRSAWLAYGIALAHYGAASFDAALRWFTRATGDRMDTIEVKSLFMTALCALRRGEFEVAHRSLLEFAKSYPLHIRGARLALELGDRIGAARPDFLVAQVHDQQVLVHKGV